MKLLLTEDQIKSTEHIPTSEIRQDIAATKREIDQYQKELDAFMGDRQNNKMAIYITEGKILNRKDFINKLQLVLDYRLEKS